MHVGWFDLSKSIQSQGSSLSVEPIFISRNSDQTVALMTYFGLRATQHH